MQHFSIQKFPRPNHILYSTFSLPNTCGPLPNTWGLLPNKCGPLPVRLPSQGLGPHRNFKTTLLIDTSQQQGKLSIDLLDLFAKKVTLHLQRS